MYSLMGAETTRIDLAHDRFPYCIVWTPIPLLTYVGAVLRVLSAPALVVWEETRA